ncbi:MAG TPA: dihydrofolate reductase family protein [Thermoanaerobaculia bacterium]|jgi:dihydrofolate reductase
MRRLSVFESVTLDGYFTGRDGDLSWAHAGADDPEFGRFIAGNASGEGTLLFGRKTYEMMVAYWPTPAAAKNDPKVAEGMNHMTKHVFSRSLENASWSHTTVMKGDLGHEVVDLKEGAATDLVILGSGSLVAQLAGTGLIDEYQLVVCPVVLGGGRTLFEGLAKRLDLRLTESRAFANGKVFLRYAAGS